MRKVTLAIFSCALLAGTALAQQKTEFILDVPTSDDPTAGYEIGVHSGARSVAGPYDLDGDGLYEMLVADYTGGGRVHVVENVGPDLWELVYSTPYLDPTADTQNARIAKGGDLDGDGFGEILFFCGWSYSDDGGKLLVPTPGICVFEHTGEDNDYGDAPAGLYDYTGDTPDRSRHEVLEIDDVDGDGIQEMLFANNGADNLYDSWYVVSVTGDIGSGFEAWVEEVRLTSRADEGVDNVARGGGSPYGIVSADLNGDGLKEIAMNAWNSFNFTNARATGPDAYEAPAEGALNIFYQAGPGDHVALFGGVAADVDGDGNDEVFWPRYQSFGTGAVSVLNYDPDEDVLQVTADQLILDVITGLSNLGITAGDLDGDGLPELIGVGDNTSFTAADYNAGEESMEIAVATFLGGDVEDPASYEVMQWNTSSPTDTLVFNTIVRDSAGVVTTYYEGGVGMSTKPAYLGDADMDGFYEVAITYQVPPDSISIIDEVWTAVTEDSSAYVRTVREKTAAPVRAFMRVLSTNSVSTSIADERIVLPSDYKLEGNYPNPFNPTTTIAFTLPIDKTISVRVYDVSGRLVRSIVDNQLYAQGTHQVTWDGLDASGMQVASGTYLYALEYGNFRQTRKMVLLK